MDDLKAKLAIQEVELKSRSETTEKLLMSVGQETEKVGEEKVIADEEEKKVRTNNKCVTSTLNFVIGFLH